MRSRFGPIDPSGMRARLVATLTVIVTMLVLALGMVAMIAFDRSVEPELANRTRLIGTIVRSDVQRGLALGIPLERLEGLGQHLTETLQKFSEIDRIAINTASGLTIAEVQSREPPSFLQRAGLGQVITVGRNAFSLPILDGNQLVGSVVVEVSPQFVESRLREVFLDILVIALVAMVFAVELVLVVAMTSVGKPFDRILSLLNAQSRGIFLNRIRPSGLAVFRRTAVRLNDRADDLAERLATYPDAMRTRMARGTGATIATGRPTRLRLSEFNDIRLTLFFFSLAAEVAAAFLPLYSGAAARPDWISPELAAAAPLMVYLVAVAALSPFGGQLARRFGPRILFLAAVPPTVLALAGMGMSETLSAIVGWRALTGVSYATATIACQEYAFRAARDGGGAGPAGAFMAVVFGGVFCGSALGGVVAGRFGFAAALYVGAGVAILSGILGMATLSGRAGDPAPEMRVPANSAQGDHGGRATLLGLLLGIAVPMNASTAIFIWYLTPLMLAGLGYGASDIARVVMLYYLAAVLVGPTVTKLSDGRIAPAAFITIGSVVSGLALLSIGVWDGLWAVTVGVAGLGLGHALIRAPQYALAVRLAGGSSRNLGALRLVERLGALSGLTACALYLPAIGAESAIVGLGLVILAGSVAFAAVRLAGGRRSALLNTTKGGRQHMWRSVIIATAILAGLAGSASAADYKVMIVTWRGCEEACNGFRGYLDERGVAAEFLMRDAGQRKETIPGFLEEARGADVDLIVTWGTSVTRGIAGTLADRGNPAFNHDVPQVFMIVSDPVGSGIVESLERTGRPNITGTYNRMPEQVTIQTIRSYYPEFQRLGMLYNTNERNSVVKRDELAELAETMDFELVALDLPLGDDGAPSADDIAPMVARLKSEAVDFIYLGSSSFLLEHGSIFTAAAVENGIPFLSPYEQLVRDADALISVASRYYDVGRLAGRQAERILVEGASPGDLPVSRMTEFAVVINLAVAEKLNLFPPMDLLYLAETVN